MFLQQTFASIARSLPAVIAPAIIADLLIDPAWIGIYFGINAMASLVVQLGCGGFIVRYGALRDAFRRRPWPAGRRRLAARWPPSARR